MNLNGIKSQNFSQKKLLADFRERIEYTTHIENLAFYMERGMKLLKVHEIISFTQTNFAEDFISCTTDKRSSCSSKIQKSMWKFFNNVLFVSIKISIILRSQYPEGDYFFARIGK